MPLEGIDEVRLVVNEPFLEFPDEPAALLAVGGPALPLVELVEGAVGVAAVVDRAQVHRLELEEREVGLDDVAAVKVRRHVEVAAPDIRVQRAQLERLDLDVD